MSKQVPSKYQKAFYKELQTTTNNILVAAVAGSGKTTTAVNSINFLSPDDDAIFLAFNKSIVAELKERVPDYIDVSTLHSLGCRSYMRAMGKVDISESKMFDIAVKMVDKWNIGSLENKYSYCARVCQIVDIMRFTMTTEDEEEIFNLTLKYNITVFANEVIHAKKVLEAGNKMVSKIDFTDMIYLPAAKNIKMKRYKYVFVDELQDLNRAQQEMIRKIVHPNGGRFIGFGDSRQSIYGFAGADFESFSRMRTMFPNTVELPLSVCYRCT
jgi:DNA helicase-2/ATP-dependent DNA helicase PcrA